MREPVDPEVIAKITELTLGSVRSVAEMKRHLSNYVNNDMFKNQPKPPPTRRRYFPADTDIRNWMFKARSMNCHSKVRLPFSSNFTLGVCKQFQANTVYAVFKFRFLATCLRYVAYFCLIYPG